MKGEARHIHMKENERVCLQQTFPKEIGLKRHAPKIGKNKTKTRFFGKINKMDKSLSRLTGKNN